MSQPPFCAPVLDDAAGQSLTGRTASKSSNSSALSSSLSARSDINGFMGSAVSACTQRTWSVTRRYKVVLPFTTQMGHCLGIGFAFGV
ncbi:hypothetical protein DPMN_110579 [Dreissena polymorpha]|uniref:Uncharacterized protein n=1 Tax=Dreissena polymorpha TaxID=45954 RepID=A0A9D4KD33_DREPO|nr:hypothetical protein DPMN_110579 [Dreissena polymorpha]